MLLRINEPFGEETQTVIFAEQVHDNLPLLHASDRGVTRGYGAFEVVHGTSLGLIAFQQHMMRLQTSVSRLRLPRLNMRAWQEATRMMESLISDQGEYVLRYIVTGGGPHGFAGWIRHEHVEESTIQARGLARSAKSFDIGFPFGVNADKPWLLHGVKTLSYASHILPELIAEEEGFDDALFVSSDAYLLEGTTSSLVGLRDGVLTTTDYAGPVLPGTTQKILFSVAGSLGFEVAYAAIPCAELVQYDALWLMSASRMVTALESVDSTPIKVDLDLTSMLNEAIFKTASWDLKI